jgi:hypothetical protein
MSSHHPRILGCSSANSISVGCPATYQLSWEYFITVWPPLSDRAEYFCHFYQRELTVFLLPSGHLYDNFCHHTIPESWDVWPPPSARADSISVITSSQNLGTFDHLHQLDLTVFLSDIRPPLSAELTVFHHCLATSISWSCVFQPLPSARAESISVTFLLPLGHLYQFELTVILSPDQSGK